MEPADVLKTAFAMPLTSPSFARGPYRYTNKFERTQKHAAWTASIRMPDSTGFGDYITSRQLHLAGRCSSSIDRRTS